MNLILFRNLRCDSATRKLSCYNMSIEKRMICRPIINPEAGESSIKDSVFLYSLILAYIFCIVFEVSFSASRFSELDFNHSSKLTLLIAIMLYAGTLGTLCSVKSENCIGFESLIITS